MTGRTGTYHIHLHGKVQGVGFRPFVHRLAVAEGLAGTVRNGADGVHILFQAGLREAERFYGRLLREAPMSAKITAHRMEEVPAMRFNGFRILPSPDSDVGFALLPAPDTALCPACRADSLDSTNRRHRYPFVTCTDCGPRYGIQQKIPFDREHTTMATFDLCPTCRVEYRTPGDRRFHAQTLSCPPCGFHLVYHRLHAGRTEGPATGSEAQARMLAAVVGDLLEGRIVGVKGLGGFLLLCDATQAEPIGRLRNLKHRPDKPFALLYRDSTQLARDTRLSPAMVEAFLSPAGPVVLCPLREKTDTGLVPDLIAPGQPYIGAMRPATALLDQVSAGCGRPLVATSANVPGCPIHHSERAVLEQLGSRVDGILSDNLPLLFGQDDSVVGFSPRYGRRIVFRRGRGMAPSLSYQPFGDWHHTALAMGADLKSTVALHQGGTTLLSQPLGTLDYLEAQENHRNCLDRLLALTEAQPATLLVDQHPDCHAARLGRDRAARSAPSPRLVPVQHHTAHFAAVLAENELLRSTEKVLGVIWDGTGWGTDGQTWGGEFLDYHRGTFSRRSHLDSFPSLFGDRMAREPRLAALAACADVPGADELLRGKFRESEWAVCRQGLQNHATHRTTSVGRLFDAAAALLGFDQENTYEGAAAAYLENLAASAVSEGLPEEPYPGPFGRVSLLSRMVTDIRSRRTSDGRTALRFHLSLARWVMDIASRYGYRHVACSGGVFQNKLLVDLLIHDCPADRTLYFHRELPPNDENIAFGQLAYLYATTVVGGTESPDSDRGMPRTESKEDGRPTSRHV